MQFKYANDPEAFIIEQPQELCNTKEGGQNFLAKNCWVYYTNLTVT